MNFLSSFFRRLKREPAVDADRQIKSSDREPLYEFVRRHLDPVTGGLVDSVMELPDAALRFKPGEIRWVAGGMDGALGHHAGNGGGDEKAVKVAQRVIEIAHGSTGAERELYTLLEEDGVLSYLDLALGKLVEARVPIEPHLHAYARTLVISASDRGPVKFAIALLGLMRDNADLPLIHTLGKHEEFTLFAAVALANSASPEGELFALVHHVNGWGRVQIVERLAQTGDPEIKRWLVRKGYRNAVMYEYLAYICATAGGLAEELAADSVDEEVLDAAGDLLQALCVGGPARDMNDYDRAGLAVTRYLKLVLAAPRKMRRFLAVQSIRDYLGDEKWDPRARQDNGWDDSLRDSCLVLARDFLGDTSWQALALQGLSSADEMPFSDANQVARALRLDVWDVHWRRLKEKPDDSGRWFQVMSLANTDRIDAIVTFATEVIDLESIATGPAEENGLGPRYAPHSALDCILQELAAYPGKGRALILAGLRSPVIRNRNIALKALDAWPPETRDPELRHLLEQAARDEPRREVKERMQALLAGDTSRGT